MHRMRTTCVKMNLSPIEHMMRIGITTTMVCGNSLDQRLIHVRRSFHMRAPFLFHDEGAGFII